LSRPFAKLSGNFFEDWLVQLGAQGKDQSDIANGDRQEQNHRWRSGLTVEQIVHVMP
jgi:hypothetical protein